MRRTGIPWISLYQLYTFIINTCKCLYSLQVEKEDCLGGGHYYLRKAEGGQRIRVVKNQEPYDGRVNEIKYLMVRGCDKNQPVRSGQKQHYITINVNMSPILFALCAIFLKLIKYSYFHNAPVPLSRIYSRTRTNGQFELV